jgi:hypothetical protein
MQSFENMKREMIRDERMTNAAPALMFGEAYG